MVNAKNENEARKGEIHSKAGNLWLKFQIGWVVMVSLNGSHSGKDLNKYKNELGRYPRGKKYKQKHLSQRNGKNSPGRSMLYSSL